LFNIKVSLVQQKTQHMSTVEFHNKFSALTAVLQAFSYNLTKNLEDSRDLYQETAYRALSNREKFITGTNFKAWIFTIMKNIFINNYRKKVKANTIMDSTDNQFYINSGKNAVINEGDNNIMMEELHAMIDSLDDSIKIPFEMHHDGFKYQEIADELNLPLGTVKSRIFFARKELKDLIYKKYDKIATAYDMAH
jgi:RNA polymerase sigma-70 factor (ECF subfamily)